MCAIAAVVVGVKFPHQRRVARSKFLALDIRAKPKDLDGLPLLRCKPPGGVHFVTALANVRSGSGADSFERIGKVGPARHPVNPGIGTKGARMGIPSMQRRLRTQDFF